MIHKPPLLKFCTAGILGLCIIGSAYGQAETPNPPVCERTQQVQDRIVAAINGVSGCGDVTSTYLATIAALGLNDRGITQLQKGDFNGLTNLGSLFLYDNQLQTLDEDIFNGLTNLHTLHLNNNLARRGKCPQLVKGDLI